MELYNCTDMERIRRTEVKTDRKIKMILDTDTYNEIDDQFAIFYALASKDRIELKGITAELFYNKRSEGPADGMEKSYQEILKILKMAGVESEGLAFRGCVKPLDNDSEYVESDAVNHIISCAMECTCEDPLYIVGIGAATNIASALIKCPEIMDRIVVAWLGGNAYDWHDSWEFNLSQDKIAGKVLFDCKVPMIQVPAFGVTGFLITSVPELKECLGGKNAIGDYLVENVMSYEAIWDIGAVALLVNPEFTPQKICPAPVLTSEGKYAFDPRRHLIRCVYNMDRDAIFKDMFLKISNMQND